MNTPEEQPGHEGVLARARAALAEMAALLDEDQGPKPDEPLGWPPVWKRFRTPKSKAVELRRQRLRLRDAGRRSLAASQSRRPRSHQSRIGNAAARRDARALSRVRCSCTWLK